jgi:hypothetical protein
LATHFPPFAPTYNSKDRLIDFPKITLKITHKINLAHYFGGHELLQVQLEIDKHDLLQVNFKICELNFELDHLKSELP